MLSLVLLIGQGRPMKGRESGISVLLVTAGVLLMAMPPCYADWRNTLTRSFASPLIKRAAVQLIRNEIYDLESPPRSHVGLKHTKAAASVKRAADVLPDRVVSNSSIYAETNSASNPGSNFSASAGSIAGSFPAGNAWGTNIKSAFENGAAGRYSFKALTNAGAFTLYPMSGGTYKRQDNIKYIILHSTETASIADAKRVIRSWSNRGARHPAAQFVVDRDGTIYATTDPAMATVHINTNKTLPGYSNDNSIGIEIVRAGTQRYTSTQLACVARLVSYLQDHFQISDANITTHGHVQPSDRSDPVNFNLTAFVGDKNALRIQAIAFRKGQPRTSGADTGSVAPLWPNLVAMPKPAPDFRSITQTPMAAPPFGSRDSHF